MNKNYIIAGLAIALALIIFFTCNGKKVEKPVVIDTKTQVIEEKKKEDNLRPKLDSALAIIKQRELSLSEMKQALIVTQTKNRTNATKATAIQPQQSTEPDNEYYSQQQAIKDLVLSSEVADSLCNETVDSLTEQVEEYKHVGLLKDSLYFAAKDAFDKSIAQQNILQNYSKKLESKIKWTKAGKIAWKGVAIIGGLFILKTALK